jgi:hypothetical protein
MFQKDFMRNFLVFVFISFLSGCAKHTSINHLYPEFEGKQVVTTEVVFLLEVIADNQVNHPDYRLLFSRPKHVPTGELLLIPKGSVLNIENFYAHNRFTESGTEVQGWIKFANRKIRFFKNLNHSYSGIKKQSGLPWVVSN